MSARRASTAVALALIIAAAAALRFHGIAWGLPDDRHPGHSYHPDEAFHIAWAQSMAEGRVLPANFLYGGTLYFTMLNAYVRFGAWLHPLLDGVSPMADAILAGRIFTALLSLLTVLLTYEVGRRLLSPAAGVLGAALLAISPAHAFLASSVRPDETAALLAMVLVYLSARILQGDATGDRRHFVAAGLALGITLALRFPVAAFGIAPLAAWFLREPPATAGVALRRLFAPEPIILGVATIAGYTLASPHSLTDFPVLLQGLATVWRYETGVFPDAVGHGPGIYQHGWLQLRQGLGVPLHALALAGLLLCGLRRSPGRLLLLAAVLPCFVLTTFASWTVVRYTLPLLPVLALAAAELIVALGQRPGPPRFAAAAVAVLAVAWTLAADTAFARVRAGVNTRDVAGAWLARESGRGEGIVTVHGYAGDVFYSPPVPAERRHLVFHLVHGSDPRELAQVPRGTWLCLGENIYGNMERLGASHPLPETRVLQELLESGAFRLEAQIHVPVTALGLDFSGQFTSQDYQIINPGMRIYRRS